MERERFESEPAAQALDLGAQIEKLLHGAVGVEQALRCAAVNSRTANSLWANRPYRPAAHLSNADRSNSW